MVDNRIMVDDFPAPCGVHLVTRLKADASDRTYWRGVTEHGHTVVVCRYPDGEQARLRRDVAVCRWLADHAVPVAGVLAVDAESGWVVVEDLGERDGAMWLDEAPDHDRMVDRCQALLAPLENLARLDPSSLPAFNPPLDAARLRWELSGFELWAVRYRLSATPGSALGTYLDHLAARVGAHPRRVCHRDYHANNLMVRADGTVVLIDAQDLLVGPDSYDLASLLFERALAERLDDPGRRAAGRRWAERTGALPGWEARLAECRIQRGLKVLGTFTRLAFGGHRAYREWSGALARRLVSAVSADGAPDQLVACLLDLAAVGGNHAR